MGLNRAALDILQLGMAMMCGQEEKSGLGQSSPEPEEALVQFKNDKSKPCYSPEPKILKIESFRSDAR